MDGIGSLKVVWHNPNEEGERAHERPRYCLLKKHIL
jgi:hypothetical protein